MSDTIFLFTDYYPYGKEEVFVHNELSASITASRDIYVVPYRKRKTKRTLPSNATLVKDVAESSFLTRLTALLLTLSSHHTYHLPFQQYTPHSFRQWKNAFGGIYRAYVIYLSIKHHLHLYTEADVLYSYWADNTILGLVFAQQKIKALHNIPIVCRAHGFDVFEEERGVFFPAREYAFSHIEKILTVSAAGAEYLRHRYPHLAYKIGHMYLGVNNMLPPEKTFDPKNIHFVSCGNVIPLKRTHLTAQYLKKYASKHPDTEMKWTHFGTGNAMAVLEEQTYDIPENLTIDIAGSTANAEILNRYHSGCFDIFISLSQSEGVPVSVMEAMSCGIVPLCTAVGGTGEAVTDACGALLPASPSYEDFEKAVDVIKVNFASMRAQAIDRQRKIFSLQSNFAAFYRFLSRIK
ncbi:MAG: glycosyltransferase [Flavobacteriales bacterium]|nr:glycosyltransferase [Flavobacteriales bacterium]